MASLNKVLLIGNLTRPPELRYTPSGTAVADLRLAVNRNYSTQSGEKREETCFLTVVVWGKQAESCGEYLDKGSQIFVEGRLQTRSYDDKDGKKVWVTDVIAEEVILLGGQGRGGDAPQDTGEYSPPLTSAPRSARPQASQQASPQHDDFNQGVTEDDVPF